MAAQRSCMVEPSSAAARVRVAELARRGRREGTVAFKGWS